MDAGAIALFPILLVEDGENKLVESNSRDLFNERLGLGETYYCTRL